MKRLLFTGSFDPPTLGHLDMIERGASLCEQLFVGIATNGTKEDQQLFSIEERAEMLRDMTKHLSKVKIVIVPKLVVDFAKEHEIEGLVRGLRTYADMDHEFRMALANRKLSGIETLFLLSDARYAHISSSLIREIGRFASLLHDFVPKPLATKVYERIRAR